MPLSLLALPVSIIECVEKFNGKFLEFLVEHVIIPLNDDTINNLMEEIFDMREKWKRLRMGAGVTCICMFVLGIVMVIWPGISVLTACMLLGAFCILGGLYEVFRYFKLGNAGVFFRYDFSSGIFSILAGIFLLLHPHGIAMLLPIAAGLYILTRSIQDLQTAFEMRRSHYGNWIIILLLGVADLVFALLLLFNPFGGAKALTLFLGIALIVNSLRSLYLIYGISRAVKNSRNDDVIDVEWKSLD